METETNICKQPQKGRPPHHRPPQATQSEQHQPQTGLKQQPLTWKQASTSSMAITSTCCTASTASGGCSAAAISSGVPAERFGGCRRWQC